MLDFATFQLPVPEDRQRFCIVLRGEYLFVESSEGSPQQMGFYVVRTAAAEDRSTAEKIALFDLQAEILMKGLGPMPGHLAVEETKRLGDDQEDINNDFIFYPAE